ncbi:hypothetical protein FHX57_002228 [Paraburkholderia tropica]|uniref:hypothetical protein n=2 Tax=Paraburkholderia tropica TaxID=92647 RepID=UPI0016204D88|nr:hypothetical protein [Paraburkholderia tropica]MBB2999886.1 hypothetical protein [Paraburkholderia tropica]MBB6319517.1 hypothetical protein [Paraburkholderia tropica]
MAADRNHRPVAERWAAVTISFVFKIAFGEEGFFMRPVALAPCSRIWVTRVTVQITLRDDYQLLCDIMRRAQIKVAKAIGLKIVTGLTDKNHR